MAKGNRFSADKRKEMHAVVTATLSQEDMREVREVEKIIGYEFNDKNILLRALTHVSYNVNHHIEDGGDYQRLEYLGDALLDFIVAEELYLNYPSFDEGKMTKIRANVVSKTPLAKIVMDTGLIKYMRYDEHNTSLSDKLKSDIFEAIVAGIYLDSNGIKASKRFVLNYIKPLIVKESGRDILDYKSMLYEYCTKEGMKIVFDQYKTEGLAHELTFYYKLYINDELMSDCSGASKREATQKCSKEAVMKLGVLNK